MRLLKEYLSTQGYDVLTTHEPGGTEIGGKIRDVLLNPEFTKMVPLTELFLYLACRAQHIEEVVSPALDKGRIVLCDRFSDSTFAYQVSARGMKKSWVEGLNRMATDGIRPSLTILLDCPPEIGLRRVRRQASAKPWRVGRFELESLNFHRRVRKAFLGLASIEPKRIKVVDGSKAVEDVQRDIRRITDAFLQGHRWSE